MAIFSLSRTIYPPACKPCGLEAGPEAPISASGSNYNPRNTSKDYITGRGRQKDLVRARDLLFYWTVVELGMPMVDLARKFDITPAAVSYAVQREEKVTKERGYQLKI